MINRQNDFNLSAPKFASNKLEQESSKAVEAGYFGQRGFVKPAYDSYCFSNLPGTIEHAFGLQTTKRTLPKLVTDAIGADVDRVIVVFFDAFGWESFQRFRDTIELFKVIDAEGIVLKTTSQFPSTTTAHVTTLNSGRPVFEHGCCEWQYYEPKIGSVIIPFKYSAYNDEFGSLLKKGYTSSDIFPSQSFARDLSSNAVSSYQYSPKAFGTSPDLIAVYGNEGLRPYDKPDQPISLLTAKRNDFREYHYLYLDQYDSTCHDFGPFTNESDAAANSVFNTLRPLLNINDGGRTLIMLTADHGQVTQSMSTHFAINREIPEIIPLLVRNPNGELIRFGGGPRDLFLYSKKGHEDELANIIRPRVAEFADVYTQAEAAALGILGPTPLSSQFSERMGSVLILPDKNHSVFWDEPSVYEYKCLKGHHGGLTTQEMETPLLLIRR